MHKTKKCSWLRKEYRKNIFKNNKKIVGEIISLAEKLYPNNDYGDLDIILERGMWFNNKDYTGVNLKIVGHGDDKWFDIIEVQDLKAKKAFKKLRDILNVKLKAAGNIKPEKQISKNIMEKAECVLKNIKNDIAFWNKAKEADEEDAIQQKEPINNITSEDNEQLSFKFMEE